MGSSYKPTTFESHPTNTKYPKEHPVDVKIHPKYLDEHLESTSYARHDLAIIRLRDQVDNPYWGVVDEDFTLQNQEEYTIAGYGFYHPRKRSDQKLRTGVNTYTKDTLHEALWKMGLIFNEGSRQRVSFGDSGGPIIVETNGGLRILGIAREASRDSSETFHASLTLPTNRDFVFGRDPRADPDEKEWLESFEKEKLLSASSKQIKNGLVHYAAKFENLDVVKYLIGLSRGSANALNRLGQTPLHIAVGRRKVRMIELLLSKGADIEAQDQLGQTPLIVSAAFAQSEATKLLLGRGADTEAKNEKGYTPLHISILRGDHQNCLLLLESGADVQKRIGFSITPLMWAAQYLEYEIAELLLRKGADKYAKTNYFFGETAYDFAKRSRADKKLLDLLK